MSSARRSLGTTLSSSSSSAGRVGVASDVDRDNVAAIVLGAALLEHALVHVGMMIWSTTSEIRSYGNVSLEGIGGGRTSDKHLGDGDGEKERIKRGSGHFCRYYCC